MVLSSLLHFFFMPDCIHVYNMYKSQRWSDSCTCNAHAQWHWRARWRALVNMKAIAFSIDDGLKELIQWCFSNQINCLIAFKPSGEILYWCSRTIAYSFFKWWYITILLFCFLAPYGFLSAVVWLIQETRSSFAWCATSRWWTHSTSAATTHLVCSLVCSPHTTFNKHLFALGGGIGMVTEHKRWCTDCKVWISHWGQQHKQSKHHARAAREKRTHACFCSLLFVS